MTKVGKGHQISHNVHQQHHLNQEKSKLMGQQCQPHWCMQQKKLRFTVRGNTCFQMRRTNPTTRAPNSAKMFAGGLPRNQHFAAHLLLWTHHPQMPKMFCSHRTRGARGSMGCMAKARAPNRPMQVPTMASITKATNAKVKAKAKAKITDTTMAGCHSKDDRAKDFKVARAMGRKDTSKV